MERKTLMVYGRTMMLRKDVREGFSLTSIYICKLTSNDRKGIRK